MTDEPHWLDRLTHGPTFARKTYGRIFVRTEADIDRVTSIMRDIDESEVDDYMPDGFVAVWDGQSPSPPLMYGGKFDSIRVDDLRARCWAAGIDILIVTGARS